jgi:hypothetical protein
MAHLRIAGLRSFGPAFQLLQSASNTPFQWERSPIGSSVLLLYYLRAEVKLFLTDWIRWLDGKKQKVSL